MENQVQVSPELQNVLDRFPKETHALLKRASLVETTFKDENNDLVEEGQSGMHVAQAPKFSRISNSDPRTMEPCGAAYRAGEVLVHRASGAQADAGNGKMNPSVETFCELQAHYNIPGIETEINNDTLSLRAIRMCHELPDGENEVMRTLGPAHARMAMSRAALWLTVDKLIRHKGKNYFQDMGVDLSSSVYDDADMRTELYLAMQQGKWNLDALNRKRLDMPSMGAPILILKDLLREGSSYAYDERKNLYREIPRRSAYPTEEAHQEAMNALLREFPNEALHPYILRAGVAQSHYKAELKRFMDLGFSEDDMRQLATVVRSRCSDSRLTDPYLAAVGTGSVISYRTPGAFLTGPDGEFLSSVELLIEAIKTNYSGVTAWEVNQHSLCGKMATEYALCASDSGPEDVRKHFGPAFQHSGLLRATLYNNVTRHIREHGFAYYEEGFGLPLHGTDDKKIQACMALKQGKLDYLKLLELKQRDPSMPTPLYTYSHLQEKGAVYVFDITAGEKGKMIRLPATKGNLENADELLQRSLQPRRGLGRRACACGCGH